MAGGTVNGSGYGDERSGVPTLPSSVSTPLRKSGLFACVVALCNTILGISVVMISGAFARAGCVAGTAFMSLFAITSACGLHLLARTSMTVTVAEVKRRAADGGEEGGEKAASPSSFRAVAVVAFASTPRWASLIDLAVAIKCFGVATSYLMLVGSLMTTVMSDIVREHTAYSFLLERRFWVTMGFSLAAPLACSRTVGALRYVATLAIGLVVMIASLVLLYWLVPSLDACPADLGTGEAFEPDDGSGSGWMSLDEAATNLGGEDAGTSDGGVGGLGGHGGGALEQSGSCFAGARLVGDLRTLFQTLPIFVFCFTCHQNIFTICNEVIRPTAARVDRIIFFAILISFSIYATLAWGAYATFGVGMADDLLDMYPQTSLINTARVFVSLLVISCYPLQAHPCRMCILSVLKAPEAAPDAGQRSDSRVETPGNVSMLPSAPRGYEPVVLEPNGDDDEESGGTRHTGSSVANGRNGKAGLLEEDGVSQKGGAEKVCGQEGARLPSGVPQGGAGAESVAEPMSGSGGDIAGIDGSASQEDKSLLSEMQPRVLSDRDRLPRQHGSGVGMESRLLGGWEGGAGEGAAGVAKGAEKEASFWSTPAGFRHLGVTAVILVLSYLIAMLVESLDLVLSVVGATGSTTIAFILPGLLYLKVHPEPHAKRSLATMQFIAGLFVIPVALTSIALGGGEG